MTWDGGYSEFVIDWASRWVAIGAPEPFDVEGFNRFLTDCWWDDIFWRGGRDRGWWE